MSIAIETTRLSKLYGERRILDDLDLRADDGRVFGFLGANGSGKTTTIRILLGLARPTSGSVSVLGHAPGSAALRPLIGYCPDVPGFPAWMTGREVLEQAAVLFQLPKSVQRARIAELLDFAGLAGTSARVGSYSRGMRQRLGLAQALINAPRLLILDEPTSTLDPMGRRTVLDLISRLRGRTTVFFSTHLLPDVERVCDDVAILDGGRVITAGTLDAVRTQLGGTHDRVLVEVDDAARLYDTLVGKEWITGIDGVAVPGSLIITVRNPEEAARLLPAEIVAGGFGLRRLEPREATLEDVFITLVGSTGSGADR